MFSPRVSNGSTRFISTAIIFFIIVTTMLKLNHAIPPNCCTSVMLPRCSISPKCCNQLHAHMLTRCNDRHAHMLATGLCHMYRNLLMSPLTSQCRSNQYTQVTANGTSMSQQPIYTGRSKRDIYVAATAICMSQQARYVCQSNRDCTGFS